MKAKASLTFAFLPLVLASCTQERPSERPAVAPAATVTGSPQRCIPLASMQESKIRDDWTIDFMAGGKRVYRNTLPNRCPGLRAANAFSYETSLTQLCDTDIIYVLNTVGGSLQRGAGCGLGEFVPVELEQ